MPINGNAKEKVKVGVGEAVTTSKPTPAQETTTAQLPHGTTVSGGRYVVNGVLVDAHGQAIIIKD